MRCMDGVIDEFEQSMEDREEQGSMVCRSPWGPKESDTT